MRFIDMFCGIGGFRLGLTKASTQSHEGQHKATNTRGQVSMDPRRNGNEASYQCVWSNDNDKYACQIYRQHLGEVHEADIRTVDTDAIPDHDLLCAGFPCQSFSIAGKRKGFEDTRGTLFFEICRVLRAKRPGMLFLENVKGLLSADEGRTFLTILESLDELGYDCQWDVINSKAYVPQNRERVFIIGHLRGTPRPKVFPIGEADQAYSESTNGEANVVNIQKSGRGQQGIETRMRKGFGTVGTAKGGDNRQEQTVIVQIAHTHKDRWGNWIKEQDISDTLDGWGTQGIMIATCLDANYWKGWLDHGQRTMIYDVYNKKITKDCGAIREQHGTNMNAVIERTQIRRLTPIECERLQGFPDNWTQGISDSQRYKCLGNAVTVNVIEAIGKQLLEDLSLNGEVNG